jgi:CubicO group peptidase (beta-lactamase class C family)
MARKHSHRSGYRTLHLGERLEDKLPLSGDPLVLDPQEVGWASVRNLTSAQFSADFAARKNDSILIDIEVDEINGQERVSGVWQANTENRGWAEFRNLTSAQFSDKWNELRDAGYRLIDQESYTLGGQRYYAGIWIENTEGYAWASYRNATSAEFSAHFQQYKDDYLMIDFEAYDVGGSTRYAAAWVENTAGLSWVERRDLTSAQFSDYFDQYKDTYRVHDIESYQVNGEQRYAAIWVENQNDRGWLEHRDMTEDQYRNRWVRNRDLGYRLTDFEVYETAGGTRYAGVWRQNTDRPDWQFRSTIDTMAQAHRDAFDVPGMSVAIAHQGEIKYMRGFGDQDVNEDTWYSARTVNRLASVSKAVAGVLLMELAEQGDIDPDAATRDYVPQMPAHHTHTLAQLASNRGGVGHYDELGLGNVNQQYDSALEASPLFWDQPLLSTPGTDYEYSTHGYTLLGAGIEGAVGQPIDQVLYNELTVGHGLTTLRAEDRSDANWYRSQLYNTDNSEATPDNISWKILGGGLEASAYDMLRFSMKLTNGQILSPESLDLLWDIPQPNNVAYAMGWTVGTQQGARVMGKDGAQLGSRTYVRMFPDLDLSIVVLSNRSGGGHSPSALSRDIADVILAGTPQQTGDFVRDDRVDGTDFLHFQRTMGGRADLSADANGDRQVNDRDRQLWEANFGYPFGGRTGGTQAPRVVQDDVSAEEVFETLSTRTPVTRIGGGSTGFVVPEALVASGGDTATEDPLAAEPIFEPEVQQTLFAEYDETAATGSLLQSATIPLGEDATDSALEDLAWASPLALELGGLN